MKTCAIVYDGWKPQKRNKMSKEYKYEIYHINWGDGDNIFVVAGSLKEAHRKVRKDVPKGFINYTVNLGILPDELLRLRDQEWVEEIEKLLAEDCCTRIQANILKALKKKVTGEG